MGSIGALIPDDLQIITEEYAPLNYMENGTLKGISVDLMEEVLHRMGSNLTRDSFQVLPWNEGYARVSTTPDSILFSTDRFPERESQFLWVGPVIASREVLFTRTDTNRSDVTDIASLRIVALTDDCGKKYVIDAGADEQNIIEVPSAKDAVRLIENGSADAWAYNELAGQHGIDRYAGDPTRLSVGKDLGISTYYFAFHPKTSPEFVNAVNTTLQDLKRDRTNTGITEYERIVARYLSVQCATTSPGRDRVMDLVNLTAAAIATDAQGTIASIHAGESPYRDPVDSELYVFVFDTKVNLMANAVNTANTGKNLAGTTDVFGYPFRDEMIEGAVQNGTGWVSYVYSNPNSLGLYQKMSYYQLVNGSDGIEYVVGAGRYRICGVAEGNLSDQG